MEKRTFKNILVTLSFLALIPIGLGAYYYLKNQYIDWNESYEATEKEPYNNYMLFNLLKNYNEDKEFVFVEDLLTETLADEDIKNAKNPISYVFVGSEPILLAQEVDSLMGFVKKGNIAFFASINYPDTLFELLNIKNSRYNNYVYDSLISTNFSDQTLQKQSDFLFNYRRKNESIPTFWYYFNEEYLKEAETDKKGKQLKKLGYVYKKTNIKAPHTYRQYDDTDEDEGNYVEPYQEDSEGEEEGNAVLPTEKMYTNFIRVKYGKGYFYFHKNPVLFTNYYLIQEDGKKYAERTFSYLPEGDILWDERSHSYKQEKGKYNKRESPSPLSYILSQPALAWAYYTLLFSAFLFIIFRGKRMQRIIPILRKEQNTSLEFTKTVGQLYHLQKDHKRLSQLKVRLFLDFVRTKYHMNTQHIDENFKKKLSERSDINRDFINTLLSDVEKIDGQHEVSEWLLRKIHTQIQEFYTNCK